MADALPITNIERKGSQLLISYAKGIDVKVGRVTRDFSKSPQAEVVIDVDRRLSPERPGRVYRGRLGSAIALRNQGLRRYLQAACP